MLLKAHTQTMLTPSLCLYTICTMTGLETATRVFIIERENINMIRVIFYLQYKPCYPHYTDQKTEAGRYVNRPRACVFNQFNFSANSLDLIVFLSTSQKNTNIIQSVVKMVMQGIVYRFVGTYTYTHTYSYICRSLQEKEE